MAQLADDYRQNVSRTLAWFLLARRVEHLTLNEDLAFQNLYVAEMPFPANAF